MKTRSTVAISVIIPVFNGEDYVERALRSVFQQTFGNYELIIVDDDSTDGSLTTLERLARESPAPLKVIRQRHQGGGAARNRAIREASSDLVAFLDADDLWYPDKLRRVLQCFRRDPNLGLVCHNEVFIYEDDAFPSRNSNYHCYYKPGSPMFRQLYLRNFLSTSALVVKRNYLISAGLFDESLPVTHDYDLWLRVALQEPKILILDEVLGEFHIGNKSLSALYLQERCKYQSLVAKRYYPYLKQRTWLAILYYCVHMSRIYRGVGGNYFRRGELKKGFIHLAMSILHNPIQLRAYAGFLYPIYLWRVSGPRDL